MANDEGKERGGGILGLGVAFGSTRVASEGPSRTTPTGEPSLARGAPTGGAFRILVIGGFAPGADYATTGPSPRAPLEVTPATFDDVMATIEPSLAIDVEDPSDPRGKPLRAKLSFRRMKSFRPDAILQEVEELRALRSADVPHPATVAEREAPAADTADTAGLLDSILGSMARDAPSIEARQAEANHRKRGALLACILEHAEVRRLERTWRGLKLLVDRAVGNGVTVSIANATVDEVDSVLARATQNDERGPFDLLLVDHELGVDSRSLRLAEEWAKRAETIAAPLVTNAHPEVLGFDDLVQLSKTSRRVRSTEGPRAALFRALAAKDSTRWLLLAMNGVFLRPAYTSESARTGEVPFEDHSPLRGGAAWVVAILAAAAFSGSGWACAVGEARYRTVPALGVEIVQDRGSEVSTAAEVLVSPEVAGEAAAAGITLVSSVVNTDVAVLPFARMVYRGPVGGGGVQAPAELTLADQLFIGHMVHLITDVASMIPRDTDAAAARDTARIALLSMFAGEGSAATPAVETRLVDSSSVLEVTLRPRGFRGVTIGEVTLSAGLG
jgi:hypothetical protein